MLNKVLVDEHKPMKVAVCTQIAKSEAVAFLDQIICTSLWVNGANFL